MRRALAATVFVAAAWLAPQADALVLTHAELPGTNGYKVQIDGFGGDLAVTAKADGVGASYSVAGTTSGDRLEADLGPFGHVALSFVPTEEPRSTGPRGCRGGVIEEPGVWSGSFAFAAENGFTSAFATAAKGEVIRIRLRCREAARGDSLDALAAFHARRRGARGAVFSAFEFSRQKPLVSATRARSEEDVRVVDFARQRVSHARVRLDRERGRGLIRPNAPFSGRARFRRGAGLRQRWHGDLAVAFPMGDTVRLAGPRFSASLGGAAVASAAASIEGLLGLAP